MNGAAGTGLMISNINLVRTILLNVYLMMQKPYSQQHCLKEDYYNFGSGNHVSIGGVGFQGNIWMSGLNKGYITKIEKICKRKSYYPSNKEIRKYLEAML